MFFTKVDASVEEEVEIEEEETAVVAAAVAVAAAVDGTNNNRVDSVVAVLSSVVVPNTLVAVAVAAD